jgi:hypothetical protein
VSTCEVARRALLFGFAALAALVAVGCGQTGACVRYSDCSVGYSCAAGECVLLQTSAPPPATTDDASVAPTDADTGSTEDAAAAALDGSVQGDGSLDGQADALIDGPASDGAPPRDAGGATRDAPAE